MRSIFFVAYRDCSLVNSRALLFQKLSPYFLLRTYAKSDHTTKDLDKLVANTNNIPFSRSLISPVSDIYCILLLLKDVLIHRPKYIFCYNLKPSFFSLALFPLCSIINTKVIVTITGFGGIPSLNIFYKYIVDSLLRFYLPHASKVFFQNMRDYNLGLTNYKLEKSLVTLAPGSGFDPLRFFPPSISSHQYPPHKGFLMVGRVLQTKGVYDFIQVAQYFQSNCDYHFYWAGETDSDHPDSVNPSIFEQYSNITYLGNVSNILAYYHKCHSLLFPSFYNEGLPRAVIEANACGLPVICYENPGTSEIMSHGKNGFVVPSRDVNKLIHYTRYIGEISVFDYNCIRQNCARVSLNYTFQKVSSLYLKEIL